MACQICKSSHNHKGCRRLKISSFFSAQKVEVAFCSECGLGETIPSPNLDTSYYQEVPQIISHSKGVRKNYDSMSYFIAKVLQANHCSSLRIADFGCGQGFLIESLRKILPHARFEGIEPSTQSHAILKKKSISYFSSFSQVKRVDPSIRYDLICFSSVLEHLKDPEEVLLTAKSFLKKDGLIFISQAAYDGLLPTVLPFAWYGWQPHEHYYHFNRKSLRSMLDNVSLTIINFDRKSLYQRLLVLNPLWKLFPQIIVYFVSKIGLLLGSGDMINVIAKPNYRQMS